MPIFDELLMKIAKGQRLTPLEQEAFSQDARVLSSVMQFVGEMNQPSFTYIKSLRLDSRGIEADSTILQPAVFEKAYHATDTAIADGTFTEVTFNNNKYGNSSAFRLDADNKKVFLLTKAKSFNATVGHAWQANAAGVRRVDFQYYDDAGALLGTALMHVTPAAAVEENWFTATRIADLPDQTAYIKCRVKQTSGGSLNLVYFSVDLHVV